MLWRFSVTGGRGEQYQNTKPSEVHLIKKETEKLCVRNTSWFIVVIQFALETGLRGKRGVARGWEASRLAEFPSTHSKLFLKHTGLARAMPSFLGLSAAGGVQFFLLGKVCSVGRHYRLWNNEFQTVCRMWELPKQRGGVTATSQPLFSRMLGCPDITDCPPHSESHQAILLSRGEGMVRPVLCQISRAYRVDLDFLLTKKFNLFLFLIHLNPSILILLFFFSFAACWPSPDKKPWCFFGKESLLIVNWLRAVNREVLSSGFNLQSKKDF